MYVQWEPLKGKYYFQEFLLSKLFAGVEVFQKYDLKKLKKILS